MHQDVRSSFMGMLLADVARADAAHKANPDQGAKRDFVRTSFAAIEGAVWNFREHIRAIAMATSALSDAERTVLNEIAYTVDKTGRLSPQAKFLTLPAAIRLCARIGARIAPQTSMDFSGAGWQNLTAAINIRNRITHPKSLDDLMLTEGDLRSCNDALHWFLEASTQLMEATVFAARNHVEGVRDILNDLKSGDEETLRVYRSLIAGEEDVN
jgi:hypothetical protein